MSQRLLSTGVKVLTYSRLDPEHRQQPTNVQIEDAMFRAKDELLKMASPHMAAGWVPQNELTVRLLDGGDDLVLRANLLMDRSDA